MFGKKVTLAIAVGLVLVLAVVGTSPHSFASETHWVVGGDAQSFHDDWVKLTGGRDESGLVWSKERKGIEAFQLEVDVQVMGSFRNAADEEMRIWISESNVKHTSSDFKGLAVVLHSANPGISVMLDGSSIGKCQVDFRNRASPVGLKLAFRNGGKFTLDFDISGSGSWINCVSIPTVTLKNGGYWVGATAGTDASGDSFWIKNTGLSAVGAVDNVDEAIVHEKLDMLLYRQGEKLCSQELGNALNQFEKGLFRKLNQEVKDFTTKVDVFSEYMSDISQNINTIKVTDFVEQNLAISELQRRLHPAIRTEGINKVDNNVFTRIQGEVEKFLSARVPESSSTGEKYNFTIALILSQVMFGILIVSWLTGSSTLRTSRHRGYYP